MEMDSKQFSKMCKDSGLSSGPADSVIVDLSFTKAKRKGRLRLMFEDFLVALAVLAAEKKISGSFYTCCFILLGNCIPRLIHS